MLQLVRYLARKVRERTKLPRQATGPGHPAGIMLVVPVPPQYHRGRLRSNAAQALLSQVESLAVDVGGPGTHLVGVEPGAREAIMLATGVRVDIDQLASGLSYLLIANASYLLLQQPAASDLIQTCASCDIVLAGDRVRQELYAVALRVTSATQAQLPPLLSKLTCCVEQNCSPFLAVAPNAAFVSGHRACETLSPALEDIELRSARPSAVAPQYLNTAIKELMTVSGEPCGLEGSIEHLRAFLVTQGHRSQVPWIFNLLANELEYRLCRPCMTSVPPEVHLSLTSGCNIECRFCSYTHAHAIFDGVTLEQVQRLDFLRYAHTLRLSSGLGEPTLNRQLPEIVEFVARAHPHLRTNFFTNGLALGRERLINALVGRTTWINVSLNAATRDTWREVCGADQFDRVYRNVKTLHEAKRAAGSVHPLLYASLVITAHNVRDLPRMPALCRELGVDRFTVIPFFALGFDRQLGKYAADETFERCRSIYDELYPEIVREGERHRVSLELPLPSAEKRVAFGLEVRPYYDFARIGEEDPLLIGYFASRMLGRTDPPCHWLWRIALIGKTDRGHVLKDNGTHFLYPCLGPLVSVDFSARTTFDFPDTEGFRRIWNSWPFVFLRSAQQRPGVCAVCDTCRHADTRDPASFARLKELLEDWQPSAERQVVADHLHSHEPGSGTSSYGG